MLIETVLNIPIQFYIVLPQTHNNSPNNDAIALECLKMAKI